MLQALSKATVQTTILFIHAPFPGKLKFDGYPSSLLYAATPFLQLSCESFPEERVGILDPGEASPAFLLELEELIRKAPLRVVCISSSTVAIEETASIVKRIRAFAGEQVLVVVGGPHEDDCEEKVAARVPGVDLSVAGDADFVLAELLRLFLTTSDVPEHFVRRLPERLRLTNVLGGRVKMTSPWWGRESIPFDFGPIRAKDLPAKAESEKALNFSVFEASETVPVMVSRGCSYARCTFCSEPNREDGRLVLDEFGWLRDVVAAHPGAAIYFQDSIFPHTAAVATKLLPLLKELRVEWGCQVYWRVLSRAFLTAVAGAGCRYLYTGIESASPEILSAIGKPTNGRHLLERLGWMRERGLRVGLSLMFGGMTTDGLLLETCETVAAAESLAESIVETGVEVAGFYPNVLTVLPGTVLARGLAQAGHELDFYQVPRCLEFAELEDGALGYNFMTLPGVLGKEPKTSLAKHIAEVARRVQGLGRRAW